MDKSESLSHTRWECKYHIVFIPKCRRKALYGQLRKHLGEVFRQLAAQKESRIEEGHLLADHVHMLVSIPPKYTVSQVVARYDQKLCLRSREGGVPWVCLTHPIRPEGQGGTPPWKSVAESWSHSHRILREMS